MDPQGRWEYGRLELLINGFWVPLDDQTLFDNVGRRGAELACKTLGYATGAQLLAGSASALPSFSTERPARRSLGCGGTEDIIADCDVYYVDVYSYQYGFGQQVDDVALVCTNPSGPVPLSYCTLHNDMG